MSVFVYRVPVGTTVIKSSVFLVFWRDVHILILFLFHELARPCFTLPPSLSLSLSLSPGSCLLLPRVSCLSPFFLLPVSRLLRWSWTMFRGMLNSGSRARDTGPRNLLPRLFINLEWLRVTRRKASLFFHYVSIEKKP